MSDFNSRIPRNSESDREIADGVQRQRSLYCHAEGCPNLWSIDGPNGKCCSAHAWKPREQWKAITRDQFDIQTELAATPVEERLTPDGSSARTPMDWKRDTLAVNLGKLLHKQDGTRMFTGNKAWAYALKRCHEAGMKLTPAQVEAYQSVTGKVDRETTGEDVPF